MSNSDKQSPKQDVLPEIIRGIFIVIAALIAALATLIAADKLPTPDKWFSTDTPIYTQSFPETSTLLPVTHTPVALEQSDILDIDAILSKIVKGQGGIEKAAPWWKNIATSSTNGPHDPTISPGRPGCFGVAWNTMGLDHTVVVIQEKRNLQFQAGGFYALICLENDVYLSAEDVGRIQAEWLRKEYGGIWNVQVLTAISIDITSNQPARICASDGGVRNHNTSQPIYQRPEGYTSGWITSDSSDIVLPTGTITNISERYVLIIEDLPEVQILNVAMGPEHSNTWGCWFRSDLTTEVYSAAKYELELMHKVTPSARLYLINSNGLQKIN